MIIVYLLACYLGFVLGTRKSFGSSAAKMGTIAYRLVALLVRTRNAASLAVLRVAITERCYVCFKKNRSGVKQEAAWRCGIRRSHKSSVDNHAISI